MALYTIEYQSQSQYSEEVLEGIFEFNVRPCSDDSQIIIEEASKNSFMEAIFQFKNLFGFQINRIRKADKFKEFAYTYRAKVQKKKMRLPSKSALSIAEERAELESPEFYIDHHLFLRKSPLTTLKGDNASKVLERKENTSVFEYLMKLNHYVHMMLSYTKNVTQASTTADEALSLKKGVCQDYAHIFIAMARSQGIPCRYVSGYLNQGKKFQGAAFMHAWVEAYLPGYGWLGIDPTNELLADDNYIKVSHGADYLDCSPIKGILKSSCENKNTYQVKVTAQ
ncbi:MAG: transglutaminase family protein [Cytophagaceae bacterium]|jgi:transglutaminase-like putative cysteine protease|nr:transglutaminase family protein [Cytophagaceae bacterium]